MNMIVVRVVGNADAEFAVCCLILALDISADIFAFTIDAFFILAFTFYIITIAIAGQIAS